MDQDEAQSLPVTLGDLFYKSRILILMGVSQITRALYSGASDQDQENWGETSEVTLREVFPVLACTS